MGNRVDRKRRGGSPMSVLVLAGLLVAAGAGAVRAKSLYIIASMGSVDQRVPVHAYDIGLNGKLTLQAEYITPFYGGPDGGAIGLALDSRTKRLFITYEFSNIIAMIDPIKMQGLGIVKAEGAQNLAGIVFDHNKDLLYCMDRGTPNLYVYHWDPTQTQLVPAPGLPVQLEDAQAFGLALDEDKNELYVGGPAAEVRVYGTADWRLLRTISVGRNALSVAVDSSRGYLYCGGAYPVSNNFYLVQYDLVKNTKRDVKIEPEATVMGLGVDLVTGYVYVGTGMNNMEGGDDVLVFSSRLNRINTIPQIGNPTGLVVPNRHTSFNPLDLAKTVKGSAAGGIDREGRPQVLIGEEFTYVIRFDRQGLHLRDILIEDQLPAEVELLRATGDGFYGQYDPNASVPTYTWLDPPLPVEGSQTQLELVCRVRADTPPGRIITNWVTLSTRELPPTTIGFDVVAVRARAFQPLHLRKAVVVDGVEAGAAATPVSVNAGAEIVYRVTFDNKDNAEAVTNVLLTDDIPPQVEFLRARDATAGGRYDPVKQQYTQWYSTLAPGDSNSVDLVVRVRGDVAGGTTITNEATLESDETPPESDRASVRVAQAMSLLAEKTIVRGTVGQPDDRGRPGVKAGTAITYEIRVKNPSSGSTVTDITVVDILPREVEFIPAAGDLGVYDRDARTYAWRIDSLKPFDERRLTLTVQVNEKAEPNTVIGNEGSVAVRQTPVARFRADAVVRGEPVTPPPDALLEGQMYVKPDHIWRPAPAQKTELMVVVHLPQGYGKETILNTPLILTPGNVKAVGQQIFGTSTQGKVIAFFDTAPILAGTTGYGPITIKAAGALKNGQSFQGQSTIWILKP